MIYLIKVFYTLLLPPAIFVLLLMLISWRLWRNNRLISGTTLIVAALLYVSSIQPFSELILRELEYRYSIPAQASGDVIIILGSGAINDIPLPNSWSGQVSDVAAQRLIAGYVLHRQTGLPVLLSGGEVFDGEGNEAKISRDILKSMGMNAELIILEEKSLTTTENLSYAKTIMQSRGYNKPILVTSAFHMSRSVINAEKIGMAVLPYPVGYYTSGTSKRNVLSWIPSYSALRGTSIALKEYLGITALRFAK